ncbi:MAG TPA: response regulator transcription factor [Chitinophagales bacterium]|nr:response regulator transcription factor [Chitinophagales bacterium]
MLFTLIDDQKLITGALEILIKENFEEVEILSFNSAQAFLDALENGTRPDIIFVDIIMPEINGIKLIEICKKNYKNKIKIIALSSLRDSSTIKNVLNLGVNGYLSKDIAPEELKMAIQEVLAGNIYIEKNLRSRTLTNLTSDEDIVLQLTDREQEVLNGLCNGLSIKEIAAQLFLSHHTVQFYHKNIMNKFKIRKNTELIVFAIKQGLFVPSDDF